MAQRRAVSFPHAEEGVIAGDSFHDEEEQRGGFERRKLATGGFKTCAILGGFVFVVLLGAFFFGGARLQLQLQLPDPVIEQAKLDSAAHEYSVVRKQVHDGKAGAADAGATKVDSQAAHAVVAPVEPVKVQDSKPKAQASLPSAADAASSVSASASGDLQSLRLKVDADVTAVRSLKSSGVVMETDPAAKALIAKTQASVRALLRKEYGSDGPYYVEMDLAFPETMPDFVSSGAAATITIELAPIALVPYVVFYFLELVKNYKSGAFHRNAGHVLQAMASVKEGGERRGLAWQEYDAGFPHKKYTLGYAGRPGGPAFYISTVDNTDNHGPASQGSKTEADGCFGRVVRGRDVVKRMMKQPGKTKPSGFVSDSKNFIKISALRVLPKGAKIVMDEKKD